MTTNTQTVVTRTIVASRDSLVGVARGGYAVMGWSTPDTA